MGAGPQATVIGIIHGPGPTGPITVQIGTAEPDIITLPTPAKDIQVYMVVDDEYDHREGGDETPVFTRLVELKREGEDGFRAPSQASRGHGVGRGASRAAPPRGGGRGCMTICPVVKDLVEDDYDYYDDEEGDNKFTREPRDEEGYKVQQVEVQGEDV